MTKNSNNNRFLNSQNKYTKTPSTCNSKILSKLIVRKKEEAVGIRWEKTRKWVSEKYNLEKPINTRHRLSNY